MDKDEALKLAIGKIKSARDCHFAAIDPLLFEAEEILEQALAAPVQEPVAWRKFNGFRFDYIEHQPALSGMVSKEWKPLYDTTPPAAQPAPVQPVAKVDANDEGYWADILPDRAVKVGQYLYAAAQPAVPDAIHHTDLSESLEYIQGWNDCRQTMLEMMK
jgi:hypothetical protein